MPADLGVAIFGCSAFLQIHAFEDGVLAELLFDRQDSFLLATLSFQSGGILSLLAVSGLIVGE